MKKIQFILTFVLLVACSQSALSQDDSPWWRKLFKKETVDELENENPDYTTPETEIPAETEIVHEEKDADSIPSSPASLNRPGAISLDTPYELSKLDSAYRMNPPALVGFRVQIFFGDLEMARTIRTAFINSSKAYPCYLEQNPPSFAVQVGDFRTQLEAHKALMEIKTHHPRALVVPTEIEVPKM
ncbi:MAG: hypothetical protein ACI898_000518 [Flavobacteriales bacterium]|jgi:hypothetical protein